MIKKSGGTWTLFTEDGKSIIEEGSLKAVMIADQGNKQNKGKKNKNYKPTTHSSPGYTKSY